MGSTTIDNSKEITYLNYKFIEATKHLGKNNQAGTRLFELQVDFAYKLNKLRYAPGYILSRMVSNIHTFINEIEK